MISMLALTGTWMSGCMRQTTVPPDASIRRLPPAGQPDISRALPSTPGLPPRSGLPSLSLDPWQPSAPPRDWHSIVIHHTATARGDVDSIHQTHLKRKDGNGNPWLGIGYHFVIGNGNGMEDGQVEPTFRWRQQLHGAHAGDNEFNQHGIGVVLVGNFEETPPTPAQLSSVKRLVAKLKADYGIAGENVVGHSKVKATACPGRFFPMAEISRSTPQYLFGRAHSNHTSAGQLVGLRRDRTP